MVAVPVSVGANDVSDQIAQNTSVGFPSAEAAVRFDLLDGVTPPYPAYSIDPVVYSGRYAMAGWTFGEMGGVSIAEQREGFWVVICGGGGVFTTAEELQRFCGIPPQAGQPLLNAWMNALNQRQGHRVAELTTLRAKATEIPRRDFSTSDRLESEGSRVSDA